MLVGVDYASVDGNTAPDFEAAKAACVVAGSRLSFVIFRSAWGIKPDPTPARDWAQAIDAGLVCGAFLFLRMPLHGFSASPEDQVHVFADNIRRLSIQNLPPIVDVEEAGLPADQEIAWLHRAWQEMMRIYGIAPMLYDSYRVWTEDLHNLPAGEMLESPQWVAKPWPWRVRTPPNLSGEPFAGGQLDPKVPEPWGAGNWWMHQYQGDAFPMHGFSSTVDLSRFHLLRRGEAGPRVAWLRRHLGMGQVVTPVFTDAVYDALLRFQRQHALAVDGVVGPRTFAALAWQPHHDPTLLAG